MAARAASRINSFSATGAMGGGFSSCSSSRSCSCLSSARLSFLPALSSCSSSSSGFGASGGGSATGFSASVGVLSASVSSSGRSSGVGATSCVARGPNTKRAASAASSSSTSRRPSSAADARATRSAKMGARTEAMPRASAAPHTPSITALLTVTDGNSARAAATARRGLSVMGSSAAPRCGAKFTQNARRSFSELGTCSSSAMPSSKATTPKRAAWRRARPSRSITTSRVSITAFMRAAVPDGNRSAIASNTTPWSASASTPFCATGRPICKVAAKSKPPSNRAS